MFEQLRLVQFAASLCQRNFKQCGNVKCFINPPDLVHPGQGVHDHHPALGPGHQMGGHYVVTTTLQANDHNDVVTTIQQADHHTEDGSKDLDMKQVTLAQSGLEPGPRQQLGEIYTTEMYI